MANEKILNTRIRLKYDSLQNWTDKNTVLLQGEVAIAYLATSASHTTTTPDNGTHPVLMKVGPGAFNSLPWMSALAADVYAWAKKATPDWTDFPALPIEVVDNESGKFVTDVEYGANKITIHRGDVALADISDKEKIALSADLGDVSTLTTTAKTAVGAINEHDTEIGDLSKLNTENKGNLVSAINEALQAVEVGGTGSVVTVADQSGADSIKFVVKQGGNAVDVPVEIGVGSGFEISTASAAAGEGTIPTIVLSATTQASLAKADTALQEHQSLDHKADKVTGATAGNFAGLDANGNLTDSGKKAADFAPADIDTGVHSVSLTGGTNDGTLKHTVDGAATDNIAVTGLGDLAFKDSLAKADVGLGNVDNTSDADKPVSTLQAQAIANALAEAKTYADNNDANTEYHIEYDSANKKIKLVAGIDTNKMEIPTDDFIKDGMIQSVAISEDGKDLVITWNTDAGKEATTIALSELVDVMTGVDGTTIKVDVSADDKISAEVKAGSITTSHIAPAAGIVKTQLAADVQASLTKADNALQAHQSLEHLATKEALADVIDGTTPVAKATNAETADSADHASTAGHADNADNATKATQDAAGNVITATYATITSVNDIIKDNGTIDNKITAYDTSKSFGDIITRNAAEFATSGQGENADTAYNWGNHANAGYAKSADIAGSLAKADSAVQSVGFSEQDGSVVLAVNAQDYSFSEIEGVEGVEVGLGVGANSGAKSLEIKIADAGVTTAKIADAAVTSAKIADHAVSAHHMKACADYAGEDAEIWVFNCGGAE